MKNVIFTAVVLFTALSYSFDNATLKEAMETGVSIASGGLNSCALSDSGKIIKCWGNINYEKSDEIKHLPKVVQVSLGNSHGCALSEEGRVFCWGKTFFEGNFSAPTLPKIQQISASGEHACALTTEGTVKCWGYNYSGQTNVPYLPKIKQISAGWHNTCALSEEGKVTCWGLRDWGVSTVPELPKIKQVSTGNKHACALSEEGKVLCWGDSDNGETRVPELPRIKQISAGYIFTCALSEAGKTYCWGREDSAKTPSYLLDLKYLSVGGFQSCGQTNTDEIVCWGNNNYQQTIVPIIVSELQFGISPVQFTISNLEQNFQKIAKKLYLYKANFVKGLASQLAGYKIDETLPLAAGYRAFLARYFMLEMLSPIVETTDTPFIKEKVLGNLQEKIQQSKQTLNLNSMHDIDLTSGIFNIALTSSRLVLQNSTQFLLDENKRAFAEKLIADLGALEVQVKTQGYHIAQARELLRLLETNQKLIETLTTEPRTTGFGATLEKIKQYLKGKL